MSKGVSFSARMGLVQECHSVLGWGNYRSVSQSKAGATTGVSLVLGYGVSTRVSFSPRMGQLQKYHSVLGWGN